MKVNINNGIDARMKLKAGVDALANAVKVTLGPQGRNVVIENEHNEVHVTKDGVTVANSISFKDNVKNIGAQIVKQAASQTANIVGDGTTTSIVLSQAMISDGTQKIAVGLSPTNLKSGMEKATSFVIDQLRKMSNTVGDDIDKIRNIATISANNDTVLGNIIADAIHEVTNDGVVIAQESKSVDTHVEYMLGMQYNHGFLSPYFINNRENLSCEYNNAYIFVYDGTINSVEDVVKILELAVHKDKPLLIIADDVTGQALSLLVVNVLRAGFKVCATKSPGYGLKRREYLLDIAALTGATVYNSDTLKTVTHEGFGECDRFVVKKSETSIIDGKGTEESIEQRVKEIRQAITQEDSDYEREQLQQRLAKMTSGAAVIHVGAATDVELKEKKDRIDDAIYATKAAIEGGYLPGGGVALALCSLDTQDFIKDMTHDEKLGAEIVFNALKVPFNTICSNAGKTPQTILDKVLSHVSSNNEHEIYGYDAKFDRYGNLFEFGIIDPTKVTISALQNAISVTTMFLTTECVVSSDEVEENEK